jgi:hypothetical protein
MIEIIKYKAVDKGALQGFVSIYVDKFGLEINDISIFKKDGKRWVNFPSRTYDDKEGQKKYWAYLKFRESAHHEAFTKQLLDVVDKYRPEPPPDVAISQEEALPF